MSVLDSLAAHSPVKTSSGPTQFRAVDDCGPIYDATTGRTFQLVERVSDSIPHCASRAGNHAAAMLDQLNAGRKLAWQRAQLQAQLADSANVFTDANAVKAAKAKVEQLTATLKKHPAVQVDRVDRSARMLFLYGQREQG